MDVASPADPRHRACGAAEGPRDGGCWSRALRKGSHADGRSIHPRGAGGTRLIRASKIRAVMTFEFLSEVRRVSYLIMVFGMPVFLLAYGALITGITWFSKKSESAVRVYGVVDPASVLGIDGEVSQSAIEIP